MFRRFHELKERREEGFTLIELLVVVLIIAILAAIAVPVFLNQRRKAWVSQVESALKDAATAQESFRTDNTEYADTVAELETEGFNFSAEDVTVDISFAGPTSYCLTSDSLHDEAISGVYSSEDGAPHVVQDEGEVPTGSDPC